MRSFVMETNVDPERSYAQSMLNCYGIKTESSAVPALEKSLSSSIAKAISILSASDEPEREGFSSAFSGDKR